MPKNQQNAFNIYSIWFKVNTEVTRYFLNQISYAIMLSHSDITSQSAYRRGRLVRCKLLCITFLSLLLFFIGAATGLLVGKLLLDKEDDNNGGHTSSYNWGGTVTQDGVEKPVLEAIVDMMNVDNIKENLRYLIVQLVC